MEKEFEKLEKYLYAEAKKIKPASESLRVVLNRLSADDMVKSSNHVNNKGAEKGRAPSGLILNLNMFMKNFWKVAAPVFVIVLALGAFGYIKFLSPSAKTPLTVTGDNVAVVGEYESVEFASPEMNQAIAALDDMDAELEKIFDEDADDAALYGDYDAAALSDYDNISMLYE